jgi:hypothetical protein
MASSTSIESGSCGHHTAQGRSQRSLSTPSCGPQRPDPDMVAGLAGQRSATRANRHRPTSVGPRSGTLAQTSGEAEQQRRNTRRTNSARAMQSSAVVWRSTNLIRDTVTPCAIPTPEGASAAWLPVLYYEYEHFLEC